MRLAEYVKERMYEIHANKTLISTFHSTSAVGDIDRGCTMSLNDQQHLALQGILDFVCSGDKFYVLAGYAGTGKTYLLQHLLKAQLGFHVSEVVLTAPTNKAVKVIKVSMEGTGAITKTIYSLLGIKMVSDEDRMVLEFPSRMLDISMYSLVVIDEASMVNKELKQYIEKVSQAYPHIHWLYVGDPAQLGPVGERMSKIWKAGYRRSVLTQVVRNDNQLLEIATHIREQLQLFPEVNLRLHSNHSEGSGVWKYKQSRGFHKALDSAVDASLFATGETKIVAWRNKTVEEYNRLIRQRMFSSPKEQYVVSERLMIAKPIQRGTRIIAHVDDEGVIERCDIINHSVFKEFDVYRMLVRMEDKSLLELNVVHESSADLLELKLNEYAVAAKKDKTKWSHFWALRNSFDSVRYSAAQTVHRMQGSTVTNVFVDSQDVLLNSNIRESLRCLYVAVSRPTTKLILK